MNTTHNNVYLELLYSLLSKRVSLKKDEKELEVENQVKFQIRNEELQTKTFIYILHKL